MGRMGSPTKSRKLSRSLHQMKAVLLPVSNFSLMGVGHKYNGRRRITMSKAIEEKNKALVLEAFDTLFNRRDYVAAERYWSPRYIQHSAHIAPGREGLFNLIKSMPLTLKYEPGTIVADGRFRNRPWTVFWLRPACELDCSGHRSHRGRDSNRALGCDSRRGDPGAVKERSSNVRGKFPEWGRVDTNQI